MRRIGSDIWNSLEWLQIALAALFGGANEAAFAASAVISQSRFPLIAMTSHGVTDKIPFVPGLDQTRRAAR
jgi:hypothetical protein